MISQVVQAFVVAGDSDLNGFGVVFARRVAYTEFDRVNLFTLPVSQGEIMGKGRAPRDCGTVQSPAVLIDRAAVCGARRSIQNHRVAVVEDHPIGVGHDVGRGVQAAGHRLGMEQKQKHTEM